MKLKDGVYYSEFLDQILNVYLSSSGVIDINTFKTTNLWYVEPLSKKHMIVETEENIKWIYLGEF